MSGWEMRDNLKLLARPALFADVQCAQNGHLSLLVLKEIYINVCTELYND